MSDEIDDDQNGDSDDEAEILSLLGVTAGGFLRRRNPSLDDKVLITDEEYASGRGYRYGKEKNTLPSQIDSRITDRDVETEDKNGVRQYVPVYVYELDDEEVGEILDSPEIPGIGFFRDVASKIAFFWQEKKKRRKPKKQKNEPEKDKPEDEDEDIGEPIIVGKRKRRKFISQIIEEVAARHEEEALKKKNKPKAVLSVEEKRAVRVSDAFITELRGRLPEAFKKVRRWALTPMNLSALPQNPRRPFFMIPKWLLDEKLAAEEKLKTDQPDELVEYQYTGCADDEKFIGYIRTDGGQTPPVPMVKIDGRYFIPRRIEDVRGMSLRVHRQCAELIQTAEDVYRLEVDTKQRTNYYGGLDIFGELPDGEKSDEAAFAYISRVVSERLAETDEDDYAARREIKKYGKDQSRRLRKYYSKWLDQNYDLWLPNECYTFREEFFDRLAFHGSDWESKADRIWDVMQLQIHVVQRPEVIGFGDEAEIDWTGFQMYIAPVENRRDVVRIFDHWKFSKAFLNTVAAFNADDKAPASMRQRNWGVMWNPRKAETSWRYSLLVARSAGNPVLRETLLGPAWVDKQPWQDIDHDGSSIERFGQKKVAWVGAMGSIKGLSSAAGTATFPKRKDGGKSLDEVLNGFRNYDNEYKLLCLDEYFALDPVDVIENQKGIVIFSVIDDVNARLKGRFARYPGFRLRYKNCCQTQRFVEQMWKRLPAEPIVKVIEGSMWGWERKNILHWRVEIDRMLDGVYINRELRPYVEKWYRDSDERVWNRGVYYLTAMMSSLEDGISGAGAWELKDSVDVVKQGYGRGYGPPEMQQRRQEAMIEVGLHAGYYSVMKGILEWWSVRVTATKILDPKSWPDVNDLKLKVAGYLENRKLIYAVAEQTLWPKLYTLQLIPSDEPFPIRSEYAASMDDSYIVELLNTRAGVDHIPTLEEIEAADAVNRPILKELRKESTEANMERYLRVAKGRVFA